MSAKATKPLLLTGLALIAALGLLRLLSRGSRTLRLD